MPLSIKIFSASLVPYLLFLYFATRSKKFPRTALVGFYLMLLFVLVSTFTGVHVKKTYGLALDQHDFMHGFAESFLTLTNVVVAIGFALGIKKANAARRP